MTCLALLSLLVLLGCIHVSLIIGFIIIIIIIINIIIIIIIIIIIMHRPRYFC